MHHYEVILMERHNLYLNTWIWKWMTSEKTFCLKKNAIKYAESIAKLNNYSFFNVVRVETDINGNPCQGYSGLENINRAIKGAGKSRADK